MNENPEMKYTEMAYTTANCLREIQNQFPNSDFIPINEWQQKLIEKYKALKPHLPSFPELWALVSKENPDEINRTIRELGFSKQLRTLPPAIPPDFNLYVGSFLKIKQAWRYGATERKRMVDGEEFFYADVEYAGYSGCYKGEEVLPSHGYSGVSGLGSPPQPPRPKRPTRNDGMLTLMLANNDRVLIYMSDSEDYEKFNEAIEYYKNNGASHSVIGCVPFVDYKIEKDLVDAEGLRCVNHEFTFVVVQGIHGNHFILDKGGIDLKEYTAMSGTTGSSGASTLKKIIVDSPFFISIYRDGVPEPYFTDYITKEKWVKNLIKGGNL